MLFRSAEFLGTSEHEMFHDAVFLAPTGLEMHLRQIRCAYWDGAVLYEGQGETWELEPLRQLAGYLWWRDHHNIGGHKIATAWEYPGSATNFLSMCHVETVFGDWGLQDEITLLQTDWSMSQFGGEGWSTGDAYVRTVLGNWN